MDLFSFVTRRMSVQQRLDAVQRLTDPGTLALLALEDPDAEVAMAAVQRLTDQELLEKVAMRADQRSIALAALDRLDEQPLIARVMHDGVGWRSRAAAERLTDQGMLADYLTVTANDQLALDIARRITDPSALALIVRRYRHDPVRLETVRRLDDRAVLEAVAKRDPCSDVRKAAWAQLGEESQALMEVLLHE